MAKRDSCETTIMYEGRGLTVSELMTLSKRGESRATSTLGIHYYKLGDRHWEVALPLLQSASSMGNCLATHFLALLHISGNDEELGMDILRKMSSERFGPSLYCMGIIIERDDKLVDLYDFPRLDYFRESARSGHIIAQAREVRQKLKRLKYFYAIPFNLLRLLVLFFRGARIVWRNEYDDRISY